jgi:hypothetical protein
MFAKVTVFVFFVVGQMFHPKSIDNCPNNIFNFLKLILDIRSKKKTTKINFKQFFLKKFHIKQVEPKP